MGGIHTVCTHTKTHAFASFAASSFSAHVPARRHTPRGMYASTEWARAKSTRARSGHCTDARAEREAKTYSVEVVAGGLAVELALTVCLNVGDLLLLELFEHGTDQGELQEVHAGKRAKRKERCKIGKASVVQVRAVPQGRCLQARVRRCCVTHHFAVRFLSPGLHSASGTLFDSVPVF